MPSPDGPAERLDPAGRRQEPGLCVLGVEPGLDRVPGRRHVGLAEAQRLPGGDPQLVGDEVAAGDRLRDRMLDLEAGVHLEEVERAALGQEELARAGALVADGAGDPERGLRQPASRRLLDGRGRRLLEDLLVPALDRAVTLAEMDAVPVAIEQDLDLDVARPFDQPLEDEPVVAERGDRLPSRGRKRVPRARRRSGPPACPCRHRRPPA